MRTESFITAIFTDGQRSGAATVVKNQGLMVILEILLDLGEQEVAEVAVFSEISTRFEVDNRDVGGSGGLSLFIESDEGIVASSEVIIGDEWGGGAEDTRYFQVVSDKTGEAEGGIMRGVLLKIGGVVGFVDNNEAEIREGGKKGRAWANDDNWGGSVKTSFPDLMTFRFGLTRMYEDSATRKSGFKNLDELGSEGNFGY